MSEFFEWDAARYGLDIPQMDDEHQVIVNCMNRLHELHVSQASRALLGKALVDLQRATSRHFADEEAFMQRIGFPEFARHKIIHTSLLERLAQFQQQFDAKGALTEDFFAFLKMWLKAHICGIDVKYAAHSRAA